MKKADAVVIGGSAAGIPAAITARRHYPEKSIILIRKEKQVLIPCGIPYIFGTVEKPENNLIPDAAVINTTSLLEALSGSITKKYGAAILDVPSDVGAAVSVIDVAPDATIPFKVVSKKFAKLVSLSAI